MHLEIQQLRHYIQIYMYEKLIIFISLSLETCSIETLNPEESH